MVKHFRANFVAVQKLPQPTWHRLHLVSMLNVTAHNASIQIAIDEDKCHFIVVLIDTRHLLAVQGPHERLHRFHRHLHWITVCVGYRRRCFELGERDAGNDVLFDEPFEGAVVHRLGMVGRHDDDDGWHVVDRLGR